MIEIGRSALIVVDMQNDFCHSDGGVAKAGVDVSATQEMAPRLVALTAAARAAGLAVIFLANNHDAWTDSAAWKNRHRNNATSLCHPGTWGADFYAVSPQVSDRVIVKHRYNAFVGTDLDMILRARGTKALIFTGVATNICVETTARDAVVRDYEIMLVQDCLAGSSVDEHHASLRTLQRYFNAALVGSAELTAWLGAPLPDADNAVAARQPA